MLSLCQTDAAFRRVRHFNPDLDIDILFLDEAELQEDDYIEIAQVKRALVARVADIVRQASHQPQALDAAVAVVEVLISSATSHGPGQGHKHAVQAIQLLASVPERFDTAIDLFFDLVERSCAENRGQCRNSVLTAPCTDIRSTIMMQNYDQALVKLISKHRTANGMASDWNLSKPLERIKALRYRYEFRGNFTNMSKSCVGMRRTSSALFCESIRMLQGLQKRSPVVEMVRPTLAGLRSRSQELVFWARNVPMHIRTRSRTSFDADTLAAARQSTVVYHNEPVSSGARQTISKMGAEITDLKEQIQMLSTVIERSAQAKRKVLIPSSNVH